MSYYQSREDKFKIKIFAEDSESKKTTICFIATQFKTIKNNTFCVKNDKTI